MRHLNYVKDLQQKAREGKRQIRELFIRNKVRIDDEKYAWGQFLEEHNQQRQYGIYGTSAALRVLSSELSPENDIIKKSTQFIEDICEETEQGAMFHEKGDLFILYKYTHLLEVIEIEKSEITEENEFMENLQERILPEGGWGHYYKSSEDKDSQPNIIATTCGLLALRRYRPFKLTNECEKTIEWLLNRIQQNGSLKPHELALAVLALSEYENIDIDDNNYGPVFDKCKKRLLSWAERREKERIGRETKALFFQAPLGMEDRKITKYLFFRPDCLVASAVLRIDYNQQARGYTCDVVDYFSSETNSNQGFAAPLTDKKSTVDHYWIYSLLDNFIKKDAKKFVPKWLSWSKLIWWKKLLISILFLSLGVGGRILLFHVSNNNIFLRVIGWCFGFFGLGVFVDLIVDSIKH